MATRDCFSVLLLGRTGQGKSTTGNKLLRMQPALRSRTSDSASQTRKVEAFEVGINYESCTSECKRVSGNGVIVVDTPGFAGSREVGTGGIYKANLRTLRKVLRFHKRGEKFKCVLYFLPDRGSGSRAHGYLQEEIQIMHHFYGNAIFESMVVVATLDQEAACRNEESLIRKSQELFSKALELVPLSGTDKPKCPPAIFLPFEISGETLLRKLKCVVELEQLQPLSASHFVDDVCCLCALNMVYRESCDHTPENRVGVMVSKETDDIHSYEGSKCHPLFVPKYSNVQRVAGGMAHVVTLGIPYVIGRAGNGLPWPTFTSSEEFCIACKKVPGFDGCRRVRTTYPYQRGHTIYHVYVEHTHKMEQKHVKGT